MATVSELIAFITNAKKALEGARHLFSVGDHRGALSRAYYASFYAVSAVLLTDSQIYKKHSAVIAAFNRSFLKTGILGRDIGRKYRSLFDLRQLSDYDLLTSVESMAVKESLEDAEDIVNTLSQYCELWLRENKDR